MATLSGLQTQRAALATSLASGVLRATYQGRTVEYRTVAEMERVLARLDGEIAAAQSARPVRRIYILGQKFL